MKLQSTVLDTIVLVASLAAIALAVLRWPDQGEFMFGDSAQVLTRVILCAGVIVLGLAGTILSIIALAKAKR